MKNLIITMGILSLMSMGVQYETDSIRFLLYQRHAVQICREMAEAAAYTFDETDSWSAAEAAAEKILLLNMKAESAGKTVWNLRKEGNTIYAEIRVPSPEFSLSFLRNIIQECTFSAVHTA